MIYNSKKWKEISYDEYKEIIKGQSNIETLFNDKVYRELKYSELIPNNGGGILEYIHKKQEEDNKEHSPEDYKYYKADGYETVIMGNEKFIDKINQIFDIK